MQLARLGIYRMVAADRYIVSRGRDRRATGSARADRQFAPQIAYGTASSLDGFLMIIPGC